MLNSSILPVENRYGEVIIVMSFQMIPKKYFQHEGEDQAKLCQNHQTTSVCLLCSCCTSWCHNFPRIMTSTCSTSHHIQKKIQLIWPDSLSPLIERLAFGNGYLVIWFASLHPCRWEKIKIMGFVMHSYFIMIKLSALCTTAAHILSSTGKTLFLVSISQVGGWWYLLIRPWLIGSDCK